VVREPLDVPATLRELRHNDGPQPQQPSAVPESSVRDGR
jgi:hypothetical protein